MISVQKDGQELDDTKEYTVAVNNYLAGSDSYPQLADAAEVGEYSCCEELLIQFFEQGSDAVTASAAKQNMIQTTKETEEPEQPSGACYTVCTGAAIERTAGSCENRGEKRTGKWNKNFSKKSENSG